MKLRLQNINTKEYVAASTGVNWIMLLAGFFNFFLWVVPFYRKDYLHTALLLILQFVAFIWSIMLTMSRVQQTENLGLLLNVFFVFLAIILGYVIFYNKMHYKKLLKNNYKIVKAPEEFLAKNEVEQYYEPLSEEEILPLEKQLKEKSKKRILLCVVLVIINIIIMTVIKLALTKV